MITVKSQEDIARMRESGKLTGDLLKFLGKEIKVGMTTKALDRLADEYIRSFGATPSFLGYAGYPASTCISIDDTVVHGIPSDDIFCGTIRPKGHFRSLSDKITRMIKGDISCWYRWKYGR